MNARWKGNGPCPCGVSSDAFADFGDHYYCFSCSAYYTKDMEKREEEKETALEEDKKQLPVGDYYPIEERRVTLETVKKFGVTHVFDEKKDIIIRLYPWYHCEDTSKKVGVQARALPKTFRTYGDHSRAALGGQQAFPPGCAKRITVCEGYEDAMAAYEMNGRRWPVVCIHSSSSVLQEIKRNYEYLDSFEEIYLCFDADGPGTKAIHQLVKEYEILPLEKVRIIHLEEGKDVSDYLQAGRIEDFKKCWFSAEKYSPSDIFPLTVDRANEIIDSHKDLPVIDLPFARLQDMTGGLRMGETTLLTAYHKVGKTELLRTIEHHTWNTTDYNIGLMHIEDRPYRTVLSLAAQTVGSTFLDLVAQPDKSFVNEAVDATFEDGRFILVNRLGSFDPREVLSKIRFLAKAHDCKLIVFDNITKLFSGLELGSERQGIDALYSGIVTLAQECGVHIIVVMHLNDNGLPRGSRGPLADLDNHIVLSREKGVEDSELARKRSLYLEACRWTGEEGPAGDVWFNPNSGKYEDWIDMFGTVEE